MLKRILALAVIFCFLTAPAVFAKYGADTRKKIDSLKCKELQDDSWYELEVNKMVGYKNSEEMRLVEIWENRPKVKSQRAIIWEDNMEGLIARNPGVKEIKLFSQKAGKNGLIEAFAIPGADKKSIAKVKLYIKPNLGDEAIKIVDIIEAWEYKVE